MKEKIDIEKIEKEFTLLDDKELIRLLDSIVKQLKIKRRDTPIRDWRELYGAGKGLWEMDAQDYVNSLREDR